MRSLKLVNYGSNFLFIDGFEKVLNSLIEEVENEKFLKINFEGVVNISPSYMTRLIHGIIVNTNPKEITIENANDRIESTFKFALHSINKLKDSKHFSSIY
ncbi:hypothetical protein [Flagellimonas marinaquae]|uniref:hypothetical protein n=1 Tax=Flagellimonas marinaquae TaxID=254955 RepID=UPI00207652A6|nr:hypothetical protein [Allomuricauda aquimarina]USD26856.1 hypothetical protein MJO53_08155 [Allomuricauda aquimarina]